MTDVEKARLKKGDVVRTAHGRYFVAAVHPEHGPILVRCFRLWDAKKYEVGFPKNWSKKQ